MLFISCLILIKMQLIYLLFRVHDFICFALKKNPAFYDFSNFKKIRYLEWDIISKI